MLISVVIPTHNPNTDRLQRTLAGLCAQSLPTSQWECLLVDNNSSASLQHGDWNSPAQTNLRLLTETQLGLTQARRTGFLAARGDLIILVDDDNVLEPDYLERVAALFQTHEKLGAAGGKIIAEMTKPRPAWWQPEFDGLLACRNLGEEVQVAVDCVDPVTGIRDYPDCAPVGAGMAIRRAALQTWIDDPCTIMLSDRRGDALTSGGDNDIILTLLRAGWAVGYFPELVLTHLIPAARLNRDYLARLNRGIAQSWVQVLHRHKANPWSSVPRWTVPLRQLKAWFTNRVWTGPAAYIRWQGACGHFIGLGSITSQQTD